MFRFDREIAELKSRLAAVEAVVQGPKPDYVLARDFMDELSQAEIREGSIVERLDSLARQVDALSAQLSDLQRALEGEASG